MAKNKSYDEEFKKMIVELYESHTTTAANIVREYGIGSATLYKWVGQYGKIQTPDGEVTNNKEIKKLKKEINDLKIENEILKKSHGHIHAEIEDKFKFIEENKGTYDIKRLCKALKISRSEYYYHKNHRTNVYKEDNRKLDVDILRIYNESKKRYGSPKIQQMLEKEGKHVSIKRVGKRMRFLKIKSCIVKKYRPASSSKKVNSEGKENLLNQEFQANELRKKWFQT